MKRARTYLISAGEHSGDLIAADLVEALRQRLPALQPVGIVGANMLRAGVRAIASIDQLGVMGVSEVIQRIHDLKMFESSLLSRIDYERPEFAVLVDFPGLHIRLAEQLKMRGIPVVQYVAPKLWAWGAQRAAALRDNFALVLGILPSEEDFFKKLDVNYRFVGSPHKDRASKIAVSKATFGFDAKRALIALLPGSRHAELKYILPIMYRLTSSLRQQLPSTEFLLPLAPHMRFADLEAICRQLPALHQLVDIKVGTVGAGIPCIKIGHINVVSGMSLEAMAMADVALVASGTATLECGLLGTPMVVVYAMSPSNYAYAQKVVQVPYISLVNILAGRAVVPEYVQHFADADVVDALRYILPGAPGRQAQLSELEAMRHSLKGDAAPAAAAAIVTALGLKNS